MSVVEDDGKREEGQSNNHERPDENRRYHDLSEGVAASASAPREHSSDDPHNCQDQENWSGDEDDTHDWVRADRCG